ncbi:MAG: hypothetical protein ACE366_04030 [Bradymonadia bacterium]
MNARSMMCLAGVLTISGCFSDAPEGLAPAPTAQTVVKLDFEARPLPEIPLPNDIATRYDETSPTKRRINASMVAPTEMEVRTRTKIDELDGWGVLQPITIPFTGPLSIESILEGHRDADYDLSNDVVYLVNIDRDSAEFGKVHHLDVGNGNYPVVLEDYSGYWRNDPRGFSNNIFFEEINEDLDGDGVLDDGEDLNGNGTLDDGEDLNGNGVLDPPEDTDADGVLDQPNWYPGANPAMDDLAGRADALMTFYERQTNTLILRPMVPLKERTKYGVVVTRRLKDAEGNPVGSPYPFINHDGQTQDLMPLKEVLPEGLALSDVAFAFSFTTQTMESDWQAVRDGLYGHGVQKHIGEEFPPVVKGLMPSLDLDHSNFSDRSNPYIMFVEDFIPAYRLIATTILEQDATAPSFQKFEETMLTGDYLVEGTFESPQLFERYDEEGNFLPLDDQAWPVDLSRKPAPTRREDVHFWLMMPKKDVSLRAEGKHVPVMIMGHGYTSNRFNDIAGYGGYLTSKGMAVLAIDCVSHGLNVDQETKDIATRILGNFGLAALFEAVFTDRALDQNGDGVKDSGADFWTGYVFHTRDVVRQCGLDYMQLIRIVRSWDGTKRFNFDIDGDGENELAGDFDGDGVVDIGKDSLIGMSGGSLGGIMALLMGSLEPELSVAIPIAGGGGLGDVGVRSKQGGVREAVILRAMGPLFLATHDAATGMTQVETIVPELNDDASRTLAVVDGVKPWDTMKVENLRTEEVGCGYLNGEGKTRAHVATDVGDPIRITFYSGPQLVTGSEECEIKEGVQPSVVVDTFEEAVEFQTKMYEAGSPLVALAEGLGLRRSDPEFRRFLGLAQLVLDPGDPGSYLRFMSEEPMTYPGTGQTTGTHAMIITTMGDMNVPASTGLSAGRNAGIIPFTEVDERYGVPMNQQVINTYTAEAVDTLGRFTGPDGRPVHIDIENFSNGMDTFGDVPRLDPPLRAGFDKKDKLGGYSVAIFPYTDPGGAHGFDNPGAMIDDHVRACEAACPEGETCDCDPSQFFDIAVFLFDMMGDFMVSGGKELKIDPCYGYFDCK